MTVHDVTAPAGLLDPAFYADLDAMHLALADLRTHGPVVRDTPTDLVAVVGHTAVIDAEHRSADFVSGQGYRSVRDPNESSMIAQDDPGHAQQRRLISKRFTPRAVRELEPLIRRVARSLVDELASWGRCEVVNDLAAPLPAHLTAHLLGFPDERWPDIRSWSERLMRIDSMPHDADIAAGVIGACEEYAPQLLGIAERRWACPANDLISVWTDAGMSNRRMFYETGLFISGGAETTRTAISRGLRILCDHPDEWERMAKEPSSIPVAVEELLRWVSPLNNMFRTATNETTLAGVPIAAGDRLVLLYPSANRDEAVFDDPFRFDAQRTPNPHVAFGFGTHFCLGASLARLELRIVLEELTSRITALEPLTEPDIEANIFVGAVRSFELGFAAR